MKTDSNLEILPAQLDHVTGGNSVRPVPVVPITTQGMAPPKYSAGWWDFVRARGLAK
jgi:hypothetical protein